MTRILPRLHAVTDDRVLSLADLERRADRLASAGALALHVRGRSATGRRLHDVALRFRAVAPHASVLVNDRADVVVVAGVDGVHLPADGLPLPSAREIVGPDRWIGRSVHSPLEAREAEREGADFVFLGPIWATPSHPARPGLGLDAIADSSPARVIAIGGITPDRVAACCDAGAYGVAAISALWHVDDPASAAAAMLLSLSRLNT